MNRRIGLIVLGICAASAPGAFGQSATSGDGGRGHSFEVSGVVSEAYDDDITGPLRSALDPTGLESGGFSTLVAGTGKYSWQGRTVNLSTSVSSAARYYAEFDRVRSPNTNVGIGLSAPLPGAARLRVTQTASYTPSYLYNLFVAADDESVGVAPPVQPDHVVSESASQAFVSTATISRGIGRRASIDVSGEFDHTRFMRDGVRRDVSAYTLRGNVSRSLSRNVSIVAGYRYRAGEYIYGDVVVADDPTPEWQTTDDHAVDVALSFSRALSASRRLAVSAGIGLATLRAPTETRQGTYDGRQLTGQVSVEYPWSRSWSLYGAVSRQTEYVAELGEPIVLDGGSLGVSAAISRRFSLTTTAHYSRGDSALRQNSLNFDTYGGNFRLGYALSRGMGVYGEYLYYYYDFRSAALAASLPRSLERNGLRFGLTLRLPARE